MTEHMEEQACEMEHQKYLGELYSCSKFHIKGESTMKFKYKEI